MRTNSFLLLIIILVLSSCGNNQKKENISISIIETTDVHGSFFPYDLVREKDRKGSLASVYTYVDSLRKHSNNIILLDNGDILQGTPDIYYANYIDTTGNHKLAEMLNFMHYDASSVGNHDIEAGHKVYDKYNKNLKFPFLAANAIDSISNEPYFEPYTIIEKDGIKIAIIGLITPAIPKWLPEQLWSGIYFEDMIISAQKWVDIVKQEHNPELIIGLFHAGVDATYGSSDTINPLNENASTLVARQVSGFDAIFTGHDHHKQVFKVKNPNNKDVWILNAGAHAANIAQLDINLNWNKESNSYEKHFAASTVEMSNYKADEIFMRKFGDWYKGAKEYTLSNITVLKDTIFAKEALYGSSPFMNLIHQAQLEISGADISLAAPFSINAILPKGDFTIGDLFNLYRYENYLVVMELSGDEIRKYLEYSIDLWYDNKLNKDGNYLLYGNNSKSKNAGISLKNPYYNFDSGVSSDEIMWEYTINVTGEKGNRITILESNFDLKLKYKVVLNSYRANGGGGHLMQGVGLSKLELKDRIIYSSERDFRSLLGDWLQKQDTPYWPEGIEIKIKN